jgi:hypothetical protein
MSAEAYRQVIAASSRDRRDLFLAAAQRLGTPVGNVEKDFWVCWTLALTGGPAVPDYRAVIDAVARRDQVRVLIDGMTAANDLGLTTAVPARVEVLVDARLKPIRLGAQEIRFKAAAPSRLYWAGRPAMRIVQALHWLQDTLGDPGQRTRVIDRLRQILDDPDHGDAMREDLRAGMSALPIWMQEFVRDLLTSTAPQSGRAPNATRGRAPRQRP